MPDWIGAAADEIAAGAQRELEALVAVSSPSGDVAAAEEAVAVACALLPSPTAAERIACSSPGHAPDVLARMEGSGRGRVVLLGHLDTVVAHEQHVPLSASEGRLTGSGAVDMKGGVVLALGVMRALARRPETFAEACLLLVVDEEWRTAPFAHAGRFAGWDACLCFEAGQRTPSGQEGVVVRRKAAGTLRVTARGAAAHSGSAPERGRNALLALAQAAVGVAAHHDPTGPDRLTAVPTILRSGEAFNVVPASGELFCDLRADDAECFEAVVRSVPEEVGGAALQAEMARLWPGMDSRASAHGLIRAAGERLGTGLAEVERGGASDASHLASVVPCTVDGLGPRGGGAHSPQEYVLASAILIRARIALAVTAEALARA